MGRKDAPHSAPSQLARHAKIRPHSHLTFDALRVARSPAVREFYLALSMACVHEYARTYICIFSDDDAVVVVIRHRRYSRAFIHGYRGVRAHARARAA